MSDIVRNDSRRMDHAPAGNTATGLLKLIALAFMFVDHSGKVLFGNMAEMRTIGRIAFPLYVWCMIVGFYRTRNVTRYLLRIMLVGLISQPFYLLGLNDLGRGEVHVGLIYMEKIAQPFAGGFSFSALWQVLYNIFMEKPNIFLTLLMGLVALCAIREKHWLRKSWGPCCFLLGMGILALIHDGKMDLILQKMGAPFENGITFGAIWEFLKVTFLETPNWFFPVVLAGSLIWKYCGREHRPGQIWGPAAMILMATLLKADYNWRAIVFFIVLYGAQATRSGIAAVMVSYLFFWASKYSNAYTLFGLEIKPSVLPAPLSSPITALFGKISEAFALAGLPLVLIRFPKDIRLPKWLSYLLYPGHLAILIALRIIIFGWMP